MPSDSGFQIPASTTCLVASVGLYAFLQIPWPTFEPVQDDVLGLGGALVNTWADIDLDGDPDLFVGFGGDPNRLYRNDRGTLVDVGASLGVADPRATRAAAWGDFDGDGDADLLVGFAPGEASVLKLYRNDRTRFADVTEVAGLTRADGAVRQPVWVDFDNDGDLDLFVAFRDGPNAMFRNTDGRFDDVAAAIGLDDLRRSVGAVWFDADEDGDLDVFVANMDGDANGLFLNNLVLSTSRLDVPFAAGFHDDATRAGLQWGGRAPNDPANGTVRPCVADVNGDGRLDLFMANYGPNGLFLNRGGGQWDDVSKTWGIAIDGRHDTCAFADADHDGRLDLYVNGTFTGGTQYPDFLFRGTGTRFEDVTPDVVRRQNASHGASWADVDGDGDLDLALAGARPDGMHLVLRNNLYAGVRAQSLFVQVNWRSRRGHAGFPGALIQVRELGSGRLIGARLVDGGSGYNSQDSLPVHFGGVGDARLAVSVRATISPLTGRRLVAEQHIEPREWRNRVFVIDLPGITGAPNDTMTIR